MLFNMIWDFCPDLMHIIKTFFERLVVGVFDGSRRPQFHLDEPKELAEDATDAAKKKWRQKMKKYDLQKKLHALAVRKFSECKFTEADKKAVDARVKNLVGYPEWIRTSLVSHAHTSLTYHTTL